MSSTDALSPERGGLAGIVSFGAALDRGRVRTRVARAVGARAQTEAVVEPTFVLAHDGRDVHRRGPVRCAFEGRLANVGVLRGRFGCPAGASAAEVVAGGYARLAEGVIEELRGEFIVALWHCERQCGLIARDQLGARTVFTRMAGTELMFASDLKWLLRMLPATPDIDSEALLEWIVVGGAGRGRTLYDGIRRLPPGHLLRLGRRDWCERAYWRPRYVPPTAVTRDEAAAQLRGTLLRTVSSQLEGSDAIGILLSGGLDSGMVAATAREAARQGDRRLSGYSLTFPRHPAVDESALIAEVGGRLAIPTVRMPVRGGSVLSGGLEFLRAWGLPSSAPNAVFTAELQRRARREGIDLMLDGEGGDELFAAALFLPASRLRRGDVHGAWRLCRELPGADRSRARTMRAFRALALRGAAPYWLANLRRTMREPQALAPPWLSGACARALHTSLDPWSWKRAAAPFWWSHLSHTLTAGREDLWVFDYLRQIGALSGMARRHPLLDLELVELVLRLPPQHAFEARRDRALARHSMVARLPDSVRTRPEKADFTPVLRESLFGPDLPLVRRLLAAPRAEIRRFVEPSALSEALGAVSASPGFAIHAWRLAMAECWLQFQTRPRVVDELIESAWPASPTHFFPPVQKRDPALR